MLQDLGRGILRLQGPGGPVTDLQPFGPNWTGPFSLQEKAADFIIGAGRGGGPRCQMRRRFLPGYPVFYDGFLAPDPEHDRGGLVFPPEIAANVIVLGSGFPLYLPFEQPYSGPWAGDVAYRVFELFKDCGVQITTYRPDAYPGDYGTVVVGCRMSWIGTVGSAPTENFAQSPNHNYPETVYTSSALDVRLAAALIAHEACHGFGRRHVADPGNIMHDPPFPSSVLSEADRAAVRLRTKPFNHRR